MEVTGASLTWARNQPFSHRVQLIRASSAEERVEVGSFLDREDGETPPTSKPSDAPKYIETLCKDLRSITRSGRYQKAFGRQALLQLLKQYRHFKPNEDALRAMEKDGVGKEPWKPLPDQSTLLSQLKSSYFSEVLINKEPDASVDHRLFRSMWQWVSASRESSLRRLLDSLTLLRPCGREKNAGISGTALPKKKGQTVEQREKLAVQVDIAFAKISDPNSALGTKERESVNIPDEMHKLLQKALHRQSLQHILIAVKVLLCEMESARAQDTYLRSTGKLAENMLKTWVPDPARFKRDLLSRWLESVKKKWLCRTSALMISKQLGTRLEIDDRSEGLIVFHGSSFKARANAVRIKQDFGVFYFEMKVLSRVHEDDGLKAVRIGWRIDSDKPLKTLPPKPTIESTPEKTAPPPAVHLHVSCDVSGMNPIVGTRYKLRGENYDLCEAEYEKISEDDKKLYEKIERPGIKCRNNHVFQFIHRKPDSYPGWYCDDCRKPIAFDTQNVRHCSRCQQDRCPACMGEPVVSKSTYDTVIGFQLGNAVNEVAYCGMENKIFVSGGEVTEGGAVPLHGMNKVLRSGDVVGCLLDLGKEEMRYFKNGTAVHAPVPLRALGIASLPDLLNDKTSGNQFHGFVPCISVQSNNRTTHDFCVRLSESCCVHSPEKQEHKESVAPDEKGNKTFFPYQANVKDVLRFSSDGDTRVIIPNENDWFGFKKHSNLHFQCDVKTPESFEQSSWHIIMSQGRSFANSDNFDPIYDRLAADKPWRHLQSRSIQSGGYKTNPSNSQGGFEIGITRDGALFVHFYDSCTIKSATHLVQTDSWHSLGVSISHNSKRRQITCKFYVDHTLADCVNNARSTLTYGDGPLVLGGRNPDEESAATRKYDNTTNYVSSGWTGSIASVQMWNKTWTDEKLPSVCGRSASILNDKSALGYWKCNEGHGDILHDSIVNESRASGRHGTIKFGTTGKWSHMELDCGRGSNIEPSVKLSNPVTDDGDVHRRVAKCLSMLHDGDADVASVGPNGAVLVASVMCAVERLSLSHNAVLDFEKGGKGLGFLPPPETLAISPTAINFSLMLSLLNQAYQALPSQSSEYYASVTLSLFRILHANLSAMKLDEKLSAKCLGLSDPRFANKLKELLVAYATKNVFNAARDSISGSLEDSICFEAAKILTENIGLFYRTASARQKLLMNIFSTLSCASWSDNAADEVKPDYDVPVSFVGDEHMFILQLLCRRYASTERLLDELLHPDFGGTIVWGDDGSYEVHKIPEKEKNAGIDWDDVGEEYRQNGVKPIWSKEDLNNFLDGSKSSPCTKGGIVQFLKSNSSGTWLKERNLHWSEKAILRSHNKQVLYEIYEEFMSTFGMTWEPGVTEINRSTQWSVEDASSMTLEVVKTALQCLRTDTVSSHCATSLDLSRLISTILDRLFGHHRQSSEEGSDPPLLAISKQGGKIHDDGEEADTLSRSLGFDSAVPPVERPSLLFSSNDCQITHNGSKRWGSAVMKLSCPPRNGVWTWVFRIDRCDFGRAFIGLAPETQVPLKSYVGNANSGCALELRGKTYEKGRVQNRQYCARVYPGSLVYMTFDSAKDTLTFGNYHERKSYGVAFEGFTQGNTVVPVVSLRDKGDKVSLVDLFFGGVLDEEDRGSLKSSETVINIQSPGNTTVPSKLSMRIFEHFVLLGIKEMEKAASSDSIQSSLMSALGTALFTHFLPKMTLGLCLWKQIPFDFLESSLSNAQEFLKVLEDSTRNNIVDDQITSANMPHMKQLQLLMHSYIGVAIAASIDSEAYTDRNLTSSPVSSGGSDSVSSEKPLSTKDEETVDDAWCNSPIFGNGFRSKTFSENPLKKDQVSSPQEVFLSDISDGREGTRELLFFEWVYHHSTVHELLKHWCQPIIGVVRSLFALLVYHKHFEELAIIGAKELEKSCVQGGVDAKIVYQNIKPHPCFLSMMSVVNTILQSAQNSAVSRVIDKTVISEELEKKIHFLFLFNPASEHLVDAGMAKSEMIRIRNEADQFFKRSNDKMIAKVPAKSWPKTSLNFDSNSVLWKSVVSFFSSQLNLSTLKRKIYSSFNIAENRAKGYRTALYFLQSVRDSKCAAATVIHMEHAFLRTGMNMEYAVGESRSREVRSAYVELYMGIVSFMRDLTDDNQFDLQLCLLNIVGIKIEAGEFEVVQASGVFEYLRDTLAIFRVHSTTTPLSIQPMNQSSLYFYSDLAEKAVLKTVSLLASQMVLPNRGCKKDMGSIHVSLSLFEMLFNELTFAVKTLSKRFESLSTSVASTSASSHHLFFGTGNIEMFVGEISSLLLRISQANESALELTKQKWLTLLLQLLHTSPSHIQRRIMRLLRDVLPRVSPGQVKVMIPGSKQKLDGAMGLVIYFVSFASEMYLPTNCSVEDYSKLAHEFTAATRSSEAISLLRSLLESSLWSSLVENILLQRDMTKPLRSLVTLGVVGGFVEPLRPGGIVFVSNGNFSEELSENTTPRAQTISSATAIVTRYNPKSNELDIVYEADYVKDFGISSKLSVDKVTPVAEVPADANKFSARLLKGIIGNFISHTSAFDLNDLLDQSKGGDPKEQEPGPNDSSPLTTDPDWKTSVLEPSIHEQALTKKIYFVHQLRAMNNVTSNLEAVNMLVDLESGSKMHEVCNHLLRIANIETESCGLNQLEAFEDMLQVTMMKRYSQRRELSTAALAANDQSVLSGVYTTEVQNAIASHINLKKHIYKSIQLQFCNLRVEATVITKLENVLNGVFKSFVAIFLDIVRNDESSNISDNDFEECTLEFCSSQYYMMTDIASNIIANGQSYAQNDRQLGRDGWSGAVPLVEKELKTILKDILDTEPNVSASAIRYICGVLSFILTDIVEQTVESMEEETIDNDDIIVTPGMLKQTLASQQEFRRIAHFAEVREIPEKYEEEPFTICHEKSDEGEQTEELPERNERTGVARLRAMGFRKEWCYAAMEEAGGDIDAAIAWLVSNKDDLEEEDNEDLTSCSEESADEEEMFHIVHSRTAERKVKAAKKKKHSETIDGYVDDGMEEELAEEIPEDRDHRDSRSWESSRHENKSLFQVYQEVTKTLQASAMASVFPLGNSRSDFISELSALAPESLFEITDKLCKTVIILNARKLLMNLIWQLCLTGNKLFHQKTFFGADEVPPSFFNFLRLVTSRFSVPSWWLRKTTSSNISPVKTTRSIFAEVFVPCLSFTNRRTENKELTQFFYDHLGKSVCQAASREHALNVHSEKVYASFTDAEVLCKPNLFFNDWMTTLLSESTLLSDHFKEDVRVNDRQMQLFRIWAVALKSPSVIVKQQVFRILNDILQHVMRLYPRDSETAPFKEYLEMIPLSRITSMASRRVRREHENYPIYSTYSQRLVEFACTLQLVRNRQLGKVEMATVSHTPSKKMSVASFITSDSHVSLSRGKAPEKYVNAPWTSEFWIKLKSKADSLSTLACSSNCRIHLTCDGLTYEDAKMSLCRPREEIAAKPHLGRARSTSRSGDSLQPAPYSNSLARPGKFVCFEIVGNEPLAFKYEAVEDEWSHIAFVVSKEGVEKKITLYVNGELVGSHFTSHNVHLPLSCIGCKGSSFLGHLGEARYWRIARTSAEIKRDLNGPLSGISDAMREVLVGWWRFDVGSGCFIEDFSHQHLSTFAHGIDWFMEDLKYISWNKDVSEPSLSLQNSCVGHWKRKGTKRMNGKWQHDELKAISLNFSISQNALKKKRGEYEYGLEGIIEWSDSGIRVRVTGTLVSTVSPRLSKTVDDGSFDVGIDSGTINEELIDGGKITFTAKEILWGSPEDCKWIIGSQYRGTVEDGAFRGKWSNKASLVNPKATLRPLEMRFEFHAPLDGRDLNAVISDSGMDVESTRGKGPKSTWNTSFIIVGAGEGGSDASTMELLDGRIWEIKITSKHHSGQVALGFAPAGIDLTSALDNQKDTICWTVENDKLFANGKKCSSRAKSRTAEEFDVFGVLYVANPKTVYFFQNGAVIGEVSEDDMSGITWKKLRPVVSLRKDVTVSLIGLKCGFAKVVFGGRKTILEGAPCAPCSGFSSDYHVQYSDEYIGHWHLGLPHGYGHLSVHGGRWEWISNWRDGKLNGACELNPLSKAHEKQTLFDKSQMYDSVQSSLQFKSAGKQCFLFKDGKRLGASTKTEVSPHFLRSRCSLGGTEALESVECDIGGEFCLWLDKLFVFEPSTAQGSIDISEDLLTAKYVKGSDSKGILLGNRGFSSGLHYWEVKCESAQWGSMAIGVSRKPARKHRPIGGSEKFGDYGFISYRCKVDEYEGQVLYGRYYNTGDTVGVVLDMDRGIIMYIKDGLDAFVGKQQAVNFGVAHHFVRSNGDVSIGTEQQTLYPSFSLSHANDASDCISIKHSANGGGKWMSIQSGTIRDKLDDAIHAAMLIQHWEEVGVNMSPAFLKDSFRKMKNWCYGRREYKTRSGASIITNPSAEACAKVCAECGWKGGDRVRHDELGELRILGTYRNHLWYQQEGDDCGAWYWTRSELRYLLEENLLRVMHEGEEEDPRIAEGIAGLANMLAGQGIDLGMSDFRVIMIINDADLDAAINWIFSLGPEAAKEAVLEYKAEHKMTPVMDTQGGDVDVSATSDGGIDPDLGHLKDMQFDDFVSIVQEGELWTLQNDEILVTHIDKACRATSSEPAQLTANDLRLEDLKGIPRLHALCRLFILVNLNAKIESLLPLIDLSIERDALIVFKKEDNRFLSSLGAQIVSLKKIVFFSTKLKVWNDLIDHTITNTVPPEDEYDKPQSLQILKINRISAYRTKLEAIGDNKKRINRSIFGQLYHAANSWPSRNFRRAFRDIQDKNQQRAFYVDFVGEGVGDNGGPYRAVFQAACAEELELLGLLRSGPEQLREFNCGGGCYDETFLRYCNFFGRLVGTAVRQKMVIPLNLTSLVWKPLTGHHLEERDLASVDPDLVFALRQTQILIDNDLLDEDMLEDLQERFSHYLGTEKLSIENLPEVLESAKISRMQSGNPQLEAFFAGLGTVLPTELFCLFEASDLETMFCGASKVDLQLLRSKTEYADGLSEEDDHVQYFWEALEDMNSTDRAAFLKFVSACERLPLSAADFQMPFKISKCFGSGAQELRLPEGKTCFFELVLPKYSSKQICYDKLLFAIYNTPMMDGDFDQREGREAYRD